MRPSRRGLAQLGASLGATLLVLAALELALRGTYLVRNATQGAVALPYVIGHSYGPTPPWVDGLRILEPDPVLVWRGRPDVSQRYVDVFSPVWTSDERTQLLRQFVPQLPPSLRDNPSWEVSLNAEGFRDGAFPGAKQPGTLRVACIGDSWTFGANVGQDESYPRQLAARLERRFPAARVEVLNLGVLGYSSYQGLRLLETRALALEPDVVLLGFAMNDSSVAGYRDRDLSGGPEPVSLRGRALALLERIEITKLLRYLARVAVWEPDSIEHELLSAQRKANGEEAAVDYAELEPWTRVSPPDYAANLRRLIELSRGAGAEVVLLYNEFERESPYRDALRELAAATRTPLVDTSELIASARAASDRERTRALALRPSGLEGSDRLEVVFRVQADAAAAAPLYVAGAEPALGGGEPNRVALWDDATHGDERAGDGVWSLAVELPADRSVVYVYTRGGRPGHWEGLDVPDLRRFHLEAGARGRWTRPIERFGAIDLKADPWHTNAAGYALVAEAVDRELGHSSELARRALASGPRTAQLRSGPPTR